jgi:hypothetical protein
VAARQQIGQDGGPGRRPGYEGHEPRVIDTRGERQNVLSQTAQCRLEPDTPRRRGLAQGRLERGASGATPDGLPIEPGDAVDQQVDDAIATAAHRLGIELQPVVPGHGR